MDVNDAPDLTTVQTPAYGSKEWSPWVMSQFTTEELQDGNPTVDGLRRVAYFLFGAPHAFETGVEHVSLHKGAGLGACVRVMLSFCQSDYFPQGMTVTGVADCNPYNTDDPYHNYPSSTAETRAEGRALRRALLLTKVVAAEELSDKANFSGFDEEFDPTKTITPEQVNMFNLLGKAANVNLLEFMNAGKEKYQSVGDIPFSIARSMHKVLNEYANKTTEVPERFRGFQALPLPK